MQVSDSASSPQQQATFQNVETMMAGGDYGRRALELLLSWMDRQV